MEDQSNLVFRSSAKTIFYKQLISGDEAHEIRNKILATATAQNYTHGTITSGHRERYEIDTAELSLLTERVTQTLSDYFPDVKLGATVRLYRQTFGGIKPHTDGCLDGISKYTMLIYLSDDYEGGELYVKMVRSDEERAQDSPDKKHNVFKVTPKQGYAIIFNKGLLHWADDVVAGSKDLLLCDIISEF